MKYLPVLIIAMLIAVFVSGCVQENKSATGKQTPVPSKISPTINKQTTGPSRINSTITNISSLQNNTSLPQKVARKTLNVPPIPLKK